jgi:hypothetical protein
MSEDNSQRWLWIEEIAQGPFSVAKMYKMAMSGEISATTLYWSDRKQQWLALPRVCLQNQKALSWQQIDSGGITKRS